MYGHLREGAGGVEARRLLAIRSTLGGKRLVRDRLAQIVQAKRSKILIYKITSSEHQHGVTLKRSLTQRHEMGTQGVQHQKEHDHRRESADGVRHQVGSEETTNAHPE